MKRIVIPLFSTFITLIVIISGCRGRSNQNMESDLLSDTVTVADTGFTGIKKYFSNDQLLKEVTFKNGIRHGETRTFYQGGQLYQTFWFENGLRQDSAKWYYTEGQVFRSTPYKNDTVDGTQKQYYRNGRIRAKLSYIKGFRAPSLEEYTNTGKLIRDYPEIVFSIADNYNSSGKVRINLGLSDNKRKVRFYLGEFSNGVFDTVKCRMIKPVNGKYFIDLRKTGTKQIDNIGVIASILTDFGNSYLEYKKITLPYNDLK
jgi:hypothetical protein